MTELLFFVFSKSLREWAFANIYLRHFIIMTPVYSEMRSRLNKDVGPGWLIQFNNDENGDTLGQT